MTINPVRLAIEHHDNMRASMEKIRADAACIARLLVTRTVKRRGDSLLFVVTDARLGVSSVVGLYGKRSGGKRTERIGTVRDIDLMEPTDATG